MAVHESQLVSTRSRPSLAMLGNAAIASGLLGVLLGIVSIAYPPAVPTDQWSYPYPLAVHWAVSVTLAVTHGLSLLGFVGVLHADPHRKRRLATIALWVTIFGFAVLTVAELLSGAIGEQSKSSAAAGGVGAVFGVGSLLTALGSIVAGVIIIRARVWSGVGRWAVLVSGVVMLVAVTPAQAIGNSLLTLLTLVVWSLTLGWIGLAVRNGARST